MTSTTRLVGANDLATDNIGPVHRLTPEEARNVAVNLAAHVLRHPCRLDSDAGVTQCAHPAHGRDVEACRFAVEVFGVADTPPRPTRVRARKRSRGRCGVCGTLRYVTTAGVVLVHDTASGDRCTGSLNPPADEQREAS